MSNGDELSKWRVVDCTDTAYAYVCKKPKNGRGGGRGRTVIPNNPDPGSQEDGPTPRPDPSKDGFPYRFKGDKYAKSLRAQKAVGTVRIDHRSTTYNVVCQGIMQSNSTVMEDAWIGLVYDVTATGTNTKWLDGSRYDFTNYAIGEPKYDGTGQFCGQIVTNGAEFSKWKVVDCSSDAYVYVCKKTKSDNNNGGGKTKKPKVPQVVTPAPEPENPTVATPPDSKDDPFIHQFEDDKYAIQYDPNKVTFLQARMKCEEMDGELASIHSNEEVEFLKCKL
ncbi:lectin C-type domain protein [Ancylostoma ceylanicum]|uniref:Lectin C-type domain protein n=1 Tax=Ancylostoma ceylanicum TaxID=53326 RepID=A0A0D6M8C9_9BILA|nr:lectin C-type domain protein [Ancylostoma ceylanicum]